MFSAFRLSFFEHIIALRGEVGGAMKAMNIKFLGEYEALFTTSLAAGR
jgi:hypothetical protein